MRLSSGLPLVRKAVLNLAVAATVIALFYVEEDWRGQREWNVERARIAANGASLNFADYIPQSVPDAQNFMSDPFLQLLVAQDYHHELPQLVAYEDFRLRSKDAWLWSERPSSPHAPIDFKILGQRWAKSGGPLFRSEHETAERILAVYAPIDADIWRLRLEAASRPYSQLLKPLDLNLNVGELWAFCQLMGLHAAAEIEAGQPQDAVSDERILTRFVDAFQATPTVLNDIITEGVIDAEIFPTFWDGWHRGVWTAANYVLYQKFFATHDTWKQMPHIADGELAFMQSHWPMRPVGALIQVRGLLQKWWRIAPVGWFDLGRATLEADRNGDQRL